MRKRKVHREARRCVFCGGGKLTKEHIWSDWLKAHLPASGANFQILTDTQFDHASNTALLSQSLPRKRQGSLQQLKFRNVCGTCNNGWMSLAVSAAKPLAEPLIKDMRVDLDEKAQRSLATWIAISTVMAEFTDPHTQAIPYEDRISLYKTSLPPSNWSISIGRYSGVEWSPMRYYHVGGLMAEASIPRPNAIYNATPKNFQLTTYVIRSLLIQVFSSTDDSNVDFFREWRVPNGMTPIWPRFRKVIRWPRNPLLVFDDKSTNCIAKSLNGPTPRV